MRHCKTPLGKWDLEGWGGPEAQARRFSHLRLGALLRELRFLMSLAHVVSQSQMPSPDSLSSPAHTFLPL